MSAPFPPPVKEPCSECPWRRAAAPGWLGPYDAQEWIEIAHSEAAIACHKTIPPNDLGKSEDRDAAVHGWNSEGIRQCRGAAIFRENVCKSPRDPSIETGPCDTERVFARNQEFIDHHERRA